MTIRQLTTYLPFWEEMEKLLNKQIESKEILTEVQSILNRAYMKALEVGFEEGVKKMYSEQNMDSFAEWCSYMGWITGKDTGMWWNRNYKVKDKTTIQLRELWEKERRAK